MRSRRRTGSAAALLTGIALLGAGLALARPLAAAEPSITEQNLSAKIESAKTAEDHAALAAYYRAQAKAMQAQASDHDAMADQYAKLGGKGDWPTHCRAIASYDRRSAEEYESLAKLHDAHATELRGR